MTYEEFIHTVCKMWGSANTDLPHPRPTVTWPCSARRFRFGPVPRPARRASGARRATTTSSTTPRPRQSGPVRGTAAPRQLLEPDAPKLSRPGTAARRSRGRAAAPSTAR